MSKWIQWLIGITLAVLMGVTSYAMLRIDHNTELLAQTSDKFVTQREYDNDQQQLCNRLDRIEDKIDKLLRNEKH